MATTRSRSGYAPFQGLWPEAGTTGYLADAAWRLAIAYIFLEDGGDPSGYLSMVANRDYSWQWWDKHLYCLMATYYSDIRDEGPDHSLKDEDFGERLARGDCSTAAAITWPRKCGSRFTR